MRGAVIRPSSCNAGWDDTSEERLWITFPWDA